MKLPQQTCKLKNDSIVPFSSVNKVLSSLNDLTGNVPNLHQIVLNKETMLELKNIAGGFLQTFSNNEIGDHAVKYGLVKKTLSAEGGTIYTMEPDIKNIIYCSIEIRNDEIEYVWPITEVLGDIHTDASPL